MADHARRTVAALDFRGTDTGFVHLNFQGNNSGGQTKAESMDLSADGGTMVVVGNFATVDDLPRAQVVVMDLTPTSATVGLCTNAYAPACGRTSTSCVRSPWIRGPVLRRRDDRRATRSPTQRPAVRHRRSLISTAA